ncbi:PfkB family carbohydrate kinase [Kribbella sp. NBC_00662]|uniref:carbohydrate kinase family protein n=1 Tax=Kribbella sp. NBC_00662 TaxID=2975969 RepID=UPI003247960D
MARKVAVLSHAVLDEVCEPSGRLAHEEVGGAGAYAAVGASLVSLPMASMLVAGTGDADLAMLQDWCRERAIDSSGLFVVGERGPRTRIQYFADGEREETPVYGRSHFDAHTPLPQHIPSTAELGAMYLFHADEAPYWEHIAAFRSSVPILWELSAEATALEIVRERAGLVDVVSLNRAEALSLFGLASIDEAAKAASDLAPLVLLRLGAEGSLLLHAGRRIQLAAAPTVVVDPTGGGNSYSGAFIAAYQATGDPLRAARLAAAAAAVVVATRGAPRVDSVVRAAVENAADSLVVKGT